MAVPSFVVAILLIWILSTQLFWFPVYGAGEGFCDQFRHAATVAPYVSIQAQVLNVLADIRDQTGIAFLFISHDLAVVRHLCDDVVVLHRGQVVEAGPTTSVLDNPHEDYTRRLRDSIPRPGWAPRRRGTELFSEQANELPLDVTSPGSSGQTLTAGPLWLADASSPTRPGALPCIPCDESAAGFRGERAT